LVVGRFGGADLGIGALGSAASVAQEDGFIAALSTSTGAAVTAFSTDGIQTFGGHYDDSATSLAIYNGTIYVLGIFNSVDLGIGGAGTLATTGINNDVVVVALAESDGSPRSGFATGGAQCLGGSLHDAGYDIVATSAGVYVAGSFQGTDFGIGGRGTSAAVRDMDAFVARLDPTTGAGVSAFSGDGFERIGGSSTDRALALMLGGVGHIVVAGEMYSSDAGIGNAAPGGWGGGGYWRGFLLSLDPLSGLRPQQIAMAPLRAVALGSSPFTPTVTADPTSGNPISLTIDSPYVATVAGTTVTPQHAGTATIIAQQAAGNGFAAATAGRILPVVADAWTTTWPPITFGTVRAVTCDDAGNRYIAGDFSNHRDFDPRQGSIDPQATYGYTDVFVTRFNADGSYAWTQVIVGTAEELAKAIVTNNNEVVITGTFRSADLGIDVLGTMASMGGADVFVAKLAASTGEPVTTFGTNGLQRIGSQGNDDVSDLVLFDVRIYLTGTSVNVDGTRLSIGTPGSPISGTEASAFVVALNGTGAPLSGFGSGGIQVITGNGTIKGRALTYTVAGLIVGGSFNGNNLGIGGPGSLAAATSSFDGFLAALHPDSGVAVTTFGNAGLQKITGALDEEIWDLASNGNDLYAIGTFSSPDLGIGSIGTQSSVAGPDAFVAALKLSNGTANTAFSGDGLVMLASSYQDYGRRIAVIGSTVFAIGDFSGSNLGIGGYGALRSSGYNNLFLACLSRADGSAVTSFSGDGLQCIGGSGNDTTADIFARSSGDLIVAANIESHDVGYGAPGAWDGDFSRNSLVLTLPSTGILPVGIDVIDTTVVADGNPHLAPITLSPNGLGVSVTYNGLGTAPSAVGTYAVQATITQPGYSGTASGTLTIAKAKLFVTADDKERRRGATDPPFTASFSGFVGGDTASLITTPPTLTTTATSGSPTGIYPITPSGTIAPGYLVVHVPGTLSIFDFAVMNVTLRGTVAGGTTPTVQVDSTPTTQLGGVWQAAGAVGDDTHRVFQVDASNASGSTDHETITIEAVDLPLGGG
jgi:hypothetical protein